jgi:hypothetical protein
MNRNVLQPVERYLDRGVETLECPTIGVVAMVPKRGA